jgi:hypothetical protein
MSTRNYAFHYIPIKPRISYAPVVLVLCKAYEPFNVTVASWSREWAAQVAAWRATHALYGLLYVQLVESDDGDRAPAVCLYSTQDLDGLRDAACSLRLECIGPDRANFLFPDEGEDSGASEMGAAVRAGFDKAKRDERARTAKS